MKIQFIPVSKFAEDCLTPPVPAKKVLPEWYKKTPFLIEGFSEYSYAFGGTPTTVKSCNPFLDVLTSGYVFCLSNDLEIINQGDNNFLFSWRTNNITITEHSKNQHPFLPSPFNGIDAVFKFHNEFIIKTPKGYSTYFMHPVNQHDLPFRTLSGIVDTDTYMRPVHFPFQLLPTDKDVTILNRGTPLCYFFPFKRDNWNHEVKKYDQELIEKTAFNYFARIYRAYKSLHWVKKRYD